MSGPRWRLALAGAVVAAGVWLGAVGVAWGDDSVTPICNGESCKTQPNVWYTSPVTVTWAISTNPAPDQTVGCDEIQPSPHNLTATTSCDAIWTNSDEIKRSYTVHVEISNPAASATPSRGPDSNDWYNHPVGITFQGNAYSGIASCTSPTTFAGPDTLSTTVSGSCTDNAGKTASAGLALHYDATPPSLHIGADPGDGIVGLHWSTGADVAPVSSIKLDRTPGLRGHGTSVLYRGHSGSFNDSRVRNGVRYRYTVTARDQAGNVNVGTLRVTPGPRLLAPPAGAQLSAPPLLRWTPVRRASYYNVQLYSPGKVLSAWPTHARLQLAGKWAFAGKHYRLRPGRYRWYVWPGYGRRSAARYGHVIGSGTFVVVRPV